MHTLLMTERRNRTIYILDSLMGQANVLAERKDRSVSRIIEYALADYLRKHGIEPMDDDPDAEAD